MDVKGVGKEEAVFIQGENGNALVISHWTAVVKYCWSEHDPCIIPVSTLDSKSTNTISFFTFHLFF